MYQQNEIITSYINRIKSLKGYKITNEERRELLEKIKEGDKEAENEFINSFLSFVLFFVRKSYPRNADEFLDLLQAGNLKLCDFVRNEILEMDSNMNFEAYIGRILQISIYIEATKRTTIRIPFIQWKKIKKFLADREDLREELKREPTYSEIAKKYDAGSKIKRTTAITMKNYDMDNQKVSVAGFEEKVGSSTDDSLKLSETIPCENLSQAEIMDNLIDRERIDEALNKINKIEKDFLINRFGLNGDDSLIVREVADKMKISVGMAERLNKKAIINIRKCLVEYVNDYGGTEKMEELNKIEKDLKEKAMNATKKWAIKNKGRIADNQKKWKAKNKQKLADYHKQWELNNK